MWCVCRHKDDSGYFITRRSVRNTINSVLIDLGQPIESTVIKEFNTYDEAEKYMKGLEEIDKKIDDITKKK